MDKGKLLLLEDGMKVATLFLRLFGFTLVFVGVMNGLLPITIAGATMCIVGFFPIGRK